MKGNLYKNFHMYKLSLITLGAFYLLCSAVILTVGIITAESQIEDLLSIVSLIYYFLFLIATILEQMLFVPDEKQIIGSFIISNPSGAKGHVGGKYYTILIMDLCLVAACVITDTLFCLVTDNMQYSMSVIIMLFFCFNMFCSAFSNPFYLRFGANYGNAIKFGLFSTILVVVGIYLLFGDLSFLGENPMELIKKFMASGNMVLILSFIPPFSILLYYISYKISVPLYRKGVEVYEQ